MSREKTAQYFDELSVDDDDTSYSDDNLFGDDYEVVLYDEAYSKDEDNDKKEESKPKKEPENDEEEDELVVIQFDNVEPAFFAMPSIPGALDDSDIVLPEIQVEEEAEEPKEVDIWDWQHGGHSGFIPWAQGIVNMTPQHSGHDISGLERAMAWIGKLLKEFPRAMSTDFKGEIDVNHCESMRDGLYDAMKAMDERKQRIEALKGRRKKASEEEFGIVKEAQKATRIVGTSLVVPLFISGIARTLINGMVSAGHSIEDMYDDLNKKYSFTDREEFEIQLLLADMGYTMHQDRGRIDEQVDKSRSDNFDFAANYKS